MSNKRLIWCRFVQCGWHGARSWDMCQIYDSLPVQERQRIEKIEMLDEGELLVQLFQHYCISLAWIGELFQDIEITWVSAFHLILKANKKFVFNLFDWQLLLNKIFLWILPVSKSVFQPWWLTKPVFSLRTRFLINSAFTCHPIFKFFARTRFSRLAVSSFSQATRKLISFDNQTINLSCFNRWMLLNIKTWSGRGTEYECAVVRSNDWWWIELWRQ